MHATQPDSTRLFPFLSCSVLHVQYAAYCNELTWQKEHMGVPIFTHVHVQHAVLCAIHLSVCRIATFDPQTSPVPSTSDEFIRVWNRQCPTSAHKLGLLSSCGPDHMSKLFRAALPADLLSSILITLCSLHNPGSGSTGEPAGASSNVPKQEGADMQAEGVMPGSALIADSCSNAEFIFDMLHGLSGEAIIVLTAVHSVCHHNVAQ